MNENDNKNVLDNNEENENQSITPTDNNDTTTPIQETNPQNNTNQTQETSNATTTTTSTAKTTTNNNLIIIISIIIGLLILAGVGGFIAFKFISKIQAKNTANNVLKEVTDTNENAQDIINQASDIISDGVNSMKTDEYNDDLEMYVGTQSGDEVKELFDEIIMKLKKDKTHTISVTYNTTSTSDTTELTNLKQQFNDNTQYEVSMDYDDSGFINAITIKAL